MTMPSSSIKNSASERAKIPTNKNDGTHARKVMARGNRITKFEAIDPQQQRMHARICQQAIKLQYETAQHDQG